MRYRSLEDALLDLEHAGMLSRVKTEVDPFLEMSAIAKENFEANGPALLFEKVKGSPFRAVSNIFGTRERANFLFRHTLKEIKAAISFKASPKDFFKHPKDFFNLPFAGINALPRRSFSKNVLKHTCQLSDLPQIHSWPEDGGAFLTLPQVCSLPIDSKDILKSNLGMYRIQISGNQYVQNQECGLHYQINRGIAAHHQKALQKGKSLKVSVFIGGPPAHSLAAAMPMPHNIPEMVFAGILAGRGFRYCIQDGWVISTDADFCILGEISPDLKPEGPFGDHIGYYSAKHLFPYMKVHKVYHKPNAIFPFTVVHRPPAEDSIFGELIHELVAPMVPVSIDGLYEMNAVDAAGVHPLLLAIGKERFVPYATREPMELHKIANALLGFNQAALAKYLWIAAKEDSNSLSVQNVPDFFAHMLSRLHFERDLHFQTATTMDTLDYSGGKFNHGSKLVLSAAGEPCRTLGKNFAEIAADLKLPEGFSDPRQVAPGILAIKTSNEADPKILAQSLETFQGKENYPWITLTENSEFCAASFENWLWVTFTRSDPAKDIYGVNETIIEKHWQCKAPLIVDARLKPYHQKPLTYPETILSKAKQILEQEQVLKC